MDATEKKYHLSDNGIAVFNALLDLKGREYITNLEDKKNYFDFVKGIYELINSHVYNKTPKNKKRVSLKTIFKEMDNVCVELGICTDKKKAEYLYDYYSSNSSAQERLIRYLYEHRVPLNPDKLDLNSRCVDEFVEGLIFDD